VLAALLAEMDGLDSSSNILLIAATNRLDLCDEALVRHGRLGNAIHRIPRPGRSGTEAILAKHLGERVPLGVGTTVRGLIDAAGAFLFAQSGAGLLATVTYATAAKQEVRARDVVSGALLAGAVRRAKTTAALRRVRGDATSGVTERDLLDALDEALWTEAEKIRTPRAANRILDVAEGETITRVELVRARPPRTHRFLSAA
jgi:proteasome-associated ATPase